MIIVDFPPQYELVVASSSFFSGSLVHDFDYVDVFQKDAVLESPSMYLLGFLLQSVSRNSRNAVYCWLPLAAAHAKYFARTMRGAGRCVEHRR